MTTDETYNGAQFRHASCEYCRRYDRACGRHSEPESRTPEPSQSERFNGWANRETWALNLWLSNDQGLYEMTRERVAQAVEEHTPYPYTSVPEEMLSIYRQSDRERAAGEAVQDFWEELTDPDSELNRGAGFESYVDNIVSMLRDVGSDYRVDWDEIGAHWLADVTECPVEGDE